MNDKKYRSVFISDVHLGCSECKASRLLAFLGEIEAENIYLVGDIIDVWRLSYRRYWPQSHTDILLDILARTTRCRVIYVPGNHDEFLRGMAGKTILGVWIELSYEHIASDGKVYLVTHGDQVDYVYTKLPRLARFLSWCEGMINSWFYGTHITIWKRFMRFSAMHRHIDCFEEMMIENLTVDGVICGHIHQPRITESGVLYANCGDWVDHCTAIVEHYDGRLEIVQG